MEEKVILQLNLKPILNMKQIECAHLTIVVPIAKLTT